MAESLGINTLKYKLFAMIISAALTAFAGTFYAQYVLYIAPDTVMSVGMSTDILIGPVVGGMGTIGGAYYRIYDNSANSRAYPRIRYCIYWKSRTGLRCSRAAHGFSNAVATSRCN